jgi:hypothetical protein
MNNRFFSIALLALFVCASGLFSQSSSPKYRIGVDIGHKQRFWNDPSSMAGEPAPRIERATYLNGEIMKNATALNGGLAYLKGEITREQLANCDLLFIHIPAAQYRPGEVQSITDYVKNGGSLFLVMDVDYWSTLQDANVNDLLRPFGLEFGGQSPDTLVGGYTMAGIITPAALKIPFHDGRTVKGGTPFCFSKQTKENPFGTFVKLQNGGKIVAMGEGMVSLYMTSWEGVNDYQCGEFMHDVFKWLLQD